MPPRYLIIFAVVILTAQLFIYVTNRGLRWYLKPYIGQKCGFLLSALLWLLPNILMAITASRVFPQYRITAFVLFLLAYAFMLTLGLWLIRLLVKRVVNPLKLDRTLRLVAPLLYVSIIGFGLYNAYTPYVQHYAIHSDKLQGSLRIGLVSDLHLGKLFGAKQLDKLAEIMQQQQVDIILMPGDIMDDNLTYYLAENMQPHLQKLRAPLGVYATLGNHDFFGAQQQIRLALQAAGINVLADEAVSIDNRFVVVGRNDHLDKTRLPLNQLLAHLPQDNRLRILLDHRPDDIIENSQLALDLQLSGHAHKGQVFPANLITNVIYPLDHGYLNLNNRHFVVTSGYGFWGIPFRIGSQAEVVVIDINR
ncbi:metallophosphoesterase [Testudinibacter sp. TR-2022]|uniref:metallophosphoesterase n=1 Tax=Testudinibacter sp. TR-2022 TaxID=2585029 RepID=UPI00111B7552|nr:metallophosphoesterase [Testudinibacter sp. TR-2022]TNH05837.1 metallophosphoesterase [Pasteurellaceae bacterium Phil11]TNH22946.1 metallophosphoesterase [Testudinibacter sp. TR-2022]TNH27689.1 metallophosphoesterase [Testudinibacter sp. TR-2022]